MNSRMNIEDEIKARSSSLQLIDITKKFPSHNGDGEDTAVDKINLEIKSGELTTLLGPSGCGKTTTLRMVAGFESITSGKLLLENKSIESVPPNKRDMAMMFQSYALFPHMSVYKNICYGLKIQKLPKQEIKDRTEQIIDLMQIRGLEHRLPSNISGGQQQRVALARAVVIEPRVLLFDEPLSNLDAKLREYMRDELRSLQKRLGITSLYVTHDQSEAMAISDNVVLMNMGKIIQIGPPKDLYNEPESLFVADFIGKSNFLECRVIEKSGKSCEVEILNTRITVPAPGNKFTGKVPSSTAVIRPESIKVKKVGQGLFNGTVKKAVFFGNHIEYDIQVADKTIRVDAACPQEQFLFSVNENVGIDIDLKSIRILEECQAK